MTGWRDLAACRGMDPELWFQPGNGTLHAVRVCARCPVARECLGFALRVEAGHGPDYRAGIWGGVGPEHRHKLARAGVTV